MKSEIVKIRLADLTEGACSVDDMGNKIPFDEAANTDDFGIESMNGCLNVRPTYQRSFIWTTKTQEKFISSIIDREWRINPIYIASNVDITLITTNGNIDLNKVKEQQKLHPEAPILEVVDGQQRVVTDCLFRYGYISCGKINYKNFINNSHKKKKAFDNYEQDVYLINYEAKSEKIDHFNAINQITMTLTPQELRNAAYDGPFVQSLKRCFGGTAERILAVKMGLALKYVGGKTGTVDIKRQELTQLAIAWTLVLEDDKLYEELETVEDHKIFDKKDTLNMDNRITLYMEQHQFDSNCESVWDNYVKINEWIDKYFGDTSKKINELQDSPLRTVKNWAYIYRKYRNTSLPIEFIRMRYKTLMDSDCIHNKFNIPEFILMGEPDDDKIANKMLDLRFFSVEQKNEMWDIQKGICPICKKPIIRELGNKSSENRFINAEAHHIKSWRKGGKTVTSNGELVHTWCHKDIHY